MLDKNKVKLGIAPIAWTNDDMPDLGAENTFEQCISEMALAGFTELVLPAVVYAFLVSGVGLLLASAPGNAKQVYVLLPVLVGFGIINDPTSKTGL